MTDELRQDALADVVRSIVAAKAPRYGLEYADWVEDAQD